MVKYSGELGVTPVPFDEMGNAQEQDKYMLVSQVLKDASVLSLSGTDLLRHLNEGLDIPAWFSFPEVVHSLRVAYPPRSQQGFTMFFTGLPSSGKSTLANVLLSRLMELGTRSVALLDGDLARKNLSSELGFSKEHRDLDILRILYVASEIRETLVPQYVHLSHRTRQSGGISVKPSAHMLIPQFPSRETGYWLYIRHGAIVTNVFKIGNSHNVLVESATWHYLKTQIAN